MQIGGIGGGGFEAAATRQQASIAALQTANDTAKTQANALLALLEEAVATAESHADSGHGGGHGLDVTA